MAAQVDSALRQARSLTRAGQPERAVELYLGLLARFPGNRRAREGLAEATQLRDPRKAARFQRDMETVSDLMRLGQPGAALLGARALVSQAPHLPALRNLLGRILAQTGQIEEAVAEFRLAMQLDPDTADYPCNLGAVLVSAGRAEEAIAALGLARALAPRHVQTLRILAKAQYQAGDCAAAIEAAGAALALVPGDAELHADRAAAEHALGRAEAARADLRRAQALAPANAEYLRMLGETMDLGREPELEWVLERQLSRRDLPQGDRVRLLFARARIHDLAGRQDEAFAAWSEGNSLQKAVLDYDLDRDRTLFTQIRAIAAAGMVPCDATPVTTRRPIFVLGMPRSGTSLIEQILASHPRVWGAGERRDLAHAVTAAGGLVRPHGPAEIQAIRQTYLGDLARASPAEDFVVDKMPTNFRLIGQIQQALPEALIVHVRRDARATCWSNFRHYFPNGGQGTGFTHDLADLGGYYRLYDQLMEFWSATLPGRIHEISYEALIADQRGETERLLDHVGLDWQDSCLEFHKTERAVTTASASQVRRPLYAGSSDDWRRYEARLAPLLAALGDAGEEFTPT